MQILHKEAFYLCEINVTKLIKYLRYYIIVIIINIIILLFLNRSLFEKATPHGTQGFILTLHLRVTINRLSNYLRSRGSELGKPHEMQLTYLRCYHTSSLFILLNKTLLVLLGIKYLYLYLRTFFIGDVGHFKHSIICTFEF